MAAFTVVEFGWPPPAGGALLGNPVGQRQIDPAFAIAAAGLGLPIPGPLLYPIIATQAQLVAQLVELPTGMQPMRLRPEFEQASTHLKRFVSESVGLAVTARLAQCQLNWDPHLGWPRDIDLLVGTGSRADLLFPLFVGDAAGEARGRSEARVATHASPDQVNRMTQLAPWAAAFPTKLFMAWSWITQDGVRVDYFDPDEPRRIVPAGRMAEALGKQAREAFASAPGDIESSVPQIGRVRGQWQPVPGTEIEIFVGVTDPNATVVQPASDAAGAEGRREARWARVGPVVAAVRQRGDQRDLAELVADDFEELSGQSDMVE